MPPDLLCSRVSLIGREEAPAGAIIACGLSPAYRLRWPVVSLVRLLQEVPSCFVVAELFYSSGACRFLA